MEDAQVEAQMNNMEPTLVNIKSNDCNISNSIKGIEKKSRENRKHLKQSRTA